MGLTKSVYTIMSYTSGLDMRQCNNNRLMCFIRNSDCKTTKPGMRNCACTNTFHNNYYQK